MPGCWRQVRVQELDRDVEVEVAVPALVDDAHAAFAEPGRRVRSGRKIGQIGVGHGHAGKLAVYRQSADYEVVGPGRAGCGVWPTRGGSRSFPRVAVARAGTASQPPGLQAVLVETRVGDLLETAETCVAAGKHIHVDKPAGESLPQFRRLLAAATEQRCWCRWATCIATIQGSRCCSNFSGTDGLERCSRFMQS